MFSCVSSDFNAENRSDRYTAPYYFDILETFLATPLSPAANSSLLCAAKLRSLCSSDRAKSAAACGMCGGINLMVLETVGCTKALIQGWCEHGGGGVADDRSRVMVQSNDTNLLFTGRVQRDALAGSASWDWPGSGLLLTTRGSTSVAIHMAEGTHYYNTVSHNFYRVFKVDSHRQLQPVSNFTSVGAPPSAFAPFNKNLICCDQTPCVNHTGASCLPGDKTCHSSFLFEGRARHSECRGIAENNALARFMTLFGPMSPGSDVCWCIVSQYCNTTAIAGGPGPVSTLRKLPPKVPYKRYEAASGLDPAAETTLLITKISEANNEWAPFGRSTVFGLDLDAGGRLLPARAWWTAGRRLEIIGDSITAGYGCDGDNATQPLCDGNNHTDAWRSWGAVLARLTSAEYHIQAWSAIGLMYDATCAGLSPRPMATMVNWTLATGSDVHGNSLASNNWFESGRATQRPASAVLMNLGTNDYWPCHPNITKANWSDAVIGVMKTANASYGPVPFFVVCGPWNIGTRYPDGTFEMCRNSRAAVAAARAAGFNAHFYEFPQNSIPRNNTGCSGHPDRAAHRAMAQQLAVPLRKALGWDDMEHSGVPSTAMEGRVTTRQSDVLLALKTDDGVDEVSRTDTFSAAAEREVVANWTAEHTDMARTFKTDDVLVTAPAVRPPTKRDDSSSSSAPLWGASGTHARRAPASTCDGKIRLVAVATTGSKAEQAAASMLAAFLGQLAANGAATAPPLPIVSPLAAAGKPHVAVGAEAAAALGLPASDLAGLGQEGFVLSSNRTAGIRASCAVVLAGASNRSQSNPPPGTF